MKDEPRPRILNVNDDESGRYATSLILKQAGFDVREAATGAEALRLAEEEPELIILDVGLPDIGGMEVCHRLKSNPRTADISVLHLSASFVANDDQASGLEQGADGYLVQPVDPKVLVATVKAFLRLKAVERNLRVQTERLRNLHQIDRGILSALESPEAIIRTALLQLRGLLRYQRAGVGILEAGKKELLWFSAGAAGETMAPTRTSLSRESQAEMEILRQGRIEAVEDSSGMLLPPEGIRNFQAQGMRAFISAPLLSTRGLSGVMTIGWEEKRAITSEEMDIVGEVGGSITIAIEQSRLLEEKKLYESQLELRVAERTAQLEAANKELEAFSYSVSHNLRTPLRTVDGFVQILREDYGSILDAEGLRICSAISEGARDMGRLIDSLLVFSRSGRMEMRPVAIDMTAMAKAAFNELTSPEGRERIDFRIASLPRARGDAELLRLVWTNLLDNAIKYSSKQDRALIEVAAEEIGDEIVYSVRDNGAGFDMKYIGKLFGVFQRLHSAIEFEGTGAGLAIVHRIIYRHGGRVWAEGETGRGAAFYFSLRKGE